MKRDSHHNTSFNRHRTYRPRKAVRNAKGLPKDSDLEALAVTYLEVQGRLWQSVGESLLEPTKKNAATLAAEFKNAFLGLSDDTLTEPMTPGGTKAGACYVRYSCDNSNPRSLDQQLKNVLERAHRDGVFIPWSAVFADAAVTGTIATRRGYRMAKAAIEKSEGLNALYIDEIGRASRDAIESLRLGRLIERSRKRLVGATDGFDSENPQSKMMLSMFAMLHEWFVDQLRSKVHRGMRDAFEKGKNIQPPSFGYTLVPATDDDGNVILDSDSVAVRTKVIDPSASEYVVEAFTRFAEQGWSPDRIARFFNHQEVGGRVSWGRTQIVQMLTRETYVGFECYGMTRQVKDPDTGRVVVENVPREHWRRRQVPHLRIVTDELWQKVQARLAKCRSAYTRSNKQKATARSAVYPRTLVRPICGKCGSELILGRSGKYASFCCVNGRDGRHGCSLRGYKSVRIVEDAVLRSLHVAILTPEFLQNVVDDANRHLKELAKRPKRSTRGLNRQIADVEKKLGRLINALETSDDSEAITAKIREREAELKRLRKDRASLEAQNATPPSPMTSIDVEALLGDLRTLLGEKVETVAPLLRELTGPIRVTTRKEKAKTRPDWIAEFSVNLVPVIAHLTSSKDCPTTDTWEYLNSGGWTMEKKISISLQAVTTTRLLAGKAQELAAKGASLQTISRALGSTWQTTKDALTATPLPAPALHTASMPVMSAHSPKYVRLAPEVLTLRRDELMSFAKIAQQLGIAESTATRAYDFANPQSVFEAIEKKCAPKRGRYSHLGPHKHRQIIELLSKGIDPQSVADQVQCSLQTVKRAKAFPVEAASSDDTGMKTELKNRQISGISSEDASCRTRRRWLSVRG